MIRTVDIAIIGGGSAGLSALSEIRHVTDDYLIVNDGPWGTICARVGCMPSKALIEAANAFHDRAKLQAFGISGAESLSVDIPAVLRRVRELRDDFVRLTNRGLDLDDARVISGRARLLGPDRFEVAGEQFRARRIILATGSSPLLPSAWQGLSDRVYTTDTLFEQTDLPSRMAVIGLGAIGVEMALALSRLGIEVQAFDRSEGLAILTDPAVLSVARELLGAELALHTGVEVDLRAAQGGQIEVRHGERSSVFDAVLVALGRRPNLAGLGLDTLGVALDARGLPQVDPHTMQIGDLPMFLAGDVNARLPLLHEAADDGHIAGRNALLEGVPERYRRRVPLGIVFSDPVIASVGHRYAELDPVQTLVGSVRFERQGRARMAQVNHGILNLYAQVESGRLLGAELCAPAGEHLAHLLALAMERELRVCDVLRLPFYHPVIEEGLRSALRDLARQLPRRHASDLGSCIRSGTRALE